MRVANKGLHRGIPFPAMIIILVVTVAGKGNNPTFCYYFEIFLNFLRANMPTKKHKSQPQQTYAHTLANMNTIQQKHKLDLL